MATPNNIHEALAAVMAEVGYVQKEKSAGLRFTFASERAFIEAVRPEFLKNKIVIYPVAVQALSMDPYATTKGTAMNRLVIAVTYRFAHAPSDTSIDVTVLGEGADAQDKSTGKAMTIAYKYAIRQALLIETGDDPDKDQDSPPLAPAAPPKAKNGSQRKPAAKAKKADKPAPPPDEQDNGKSAYWEGLTESERGIYRSLGNLIPTLIAEVDRYENRYAVQGVIEKLFPGVKSKWPGANTYEDGYLRVNIYRAVKAYAEARDNGIDEVKAAAGAFTRQRGS